MPIIIVIVPVVVVMIVMIVIFLDHAGRQSLGHADQHQQSQNLRNVMTHLILRPLLWTIRWSDKTTRMGRGSGGNKAEKRHFAKEIYKGALVERHQPSP